MAVFRAPISPGMRWAAGTGTATPAAGYLLFQYLAGGATPQATFTDAGGLTANANPLVLNANGELPSVEMWFTGGVSYRLLLTDASLAPLPGNPVWDDDNLTGENDPAFASPNTGEWITGAAATFISSAANAAGTVFSMVGDTRALFQPNRRVRIVSASGDLPGTVTRSVFAANLTTITVDMQRNAAGAYPTVGNPITALYYAIENSGASGGLPAGIPSRALELGAPRYPGDGTARTGVDLFGPIGSNLVVFTVPPNVVAAAGGGGDQQVTGVVNGVAGSLTFNKTAHGRRTGEPIQVSVNAPPNTALLTTYIVFVVDANNFGLYAVPTGWQFEQPFLDPLTTPGGLTWGNPVAFGGAAAGATTVTPGFVAPAGVTRGYVRIIGGGGGGGGSRGSTGDGGQGGTGGNTVFNGVTCTGGGGGNGGAAAAGGLQNTGPAAPTGLTFTQGGAVGQNGGLNDRSAAASRGGVGGASPFGAGRGGAQPGGFGAGGNGGNSGAAAQGGGAGGSAGAYGEGFMAMTPSTWVSVSIAAAGSAGALGTGTNSEAGGAGGGGLLMVLW